MKSTSLPWTVNSPTCNGSSTSSEAVQDFLRNSGIGRADSRKRLRRAVRRTADPARQRQRHEAGAVGGRQDRKGLRPEPLSHAAGVPRRPRSACRHRHRQPGHRRACQRHGPGYEHPPDEPSGNGRTKPVRCAARPQSPARPGRPGQRGSRGDRLARLRPAGHQRQLRGRGARSERRANEAAPDLAEFYRGINATNEHGSDVHLSAFGHSYGSMATAQALNELGAAGVVDDAAFYGSPGPWAHRRNRRLGSAGTRGADHERVRSVHGRQARAT